MEQQFVEIKEVPILDEHDVYDDDGNIIVSIGEDKLQVIAENNNRRVDETGDECPIIVGHTLDDIPEEEQPEIVGYARHFSVKRLRNTTRKAIHCTFRIFKRFVDTVRRFPRRSVELWLKRWEIDPIALLGATTPDRNLGLLRLSRGGDPVYQKSFEDTDMPMDDNHLMEVVKRAISEHPAIKYVEKMMQDAEEADQDEMPVDETNEPIGDVEEPPAEAADEYLEDEDNDEDVEEGKEPLRLEAGYPADHNTYVPSGESIKRKKKMNRQEQEDSEVLRMQRNQLRGEVTRLQRRQASTEKSLTAVRLRLQRSEREKDLIELENEGIQFDRAEELGIVVAMPEESYQKHLDRMRKRYQRMPLGVNEAVQHSRVGKPKNSGSSKDAMDSAVDLAISKGISYEEALMSLNGSKKVL